MATTATLQIVPKSASADDSVITAEHLTVDTDLNNMLVFMEVFDADGNLIENGQTVVFNFNGSPYNATYNGTIKKYEATVTIPDIPSTYPLTGTLGGDAVAGINILVETGDASAIDSVIIIDVPSDTADAIDRLIALRINDADGNNLGSGQPVTITLNGQTETPVWSASNQRYEYNFPNPNTTGNYTVSATVSGQAVPNGSITVTAGQPVANQSQIAPASATIQSSNNQIYIVSFSDQHGNSVPNNGGVQDVLYTSNPVGVSFSGKTLNGDGTAKVTASHNITGTYIIDKSFVF